MPNTFINTLSSSVYGNGFLILTLIFSLICCFKGYKLFNFFIKFYGFIIFSILGFVICDNFDITGVTLYLIVLCFGLLGIFLSFKFYKFSVFVAVSFQAYAVFMSIIPISFICLILSGIIGSLALFFLKPVISIATSTSSAVIIASSICAFIPVLTPYSFIIFAFFAIYGSYKQIT